MDKNVNNMDFGKQLLTITEVAEITGYHRVYIWQLVKDGKIKSIQPNGGRHLIRQVDLISFLEGKREGAEQE